MSASKQSVTFQPPAVEVEFAGRMIAVEGIRGLSRISALEEGLTAELLRLQETARGMAKDPMEAFMALGFDHGALLKLAMPDVITDELLEQSTAGERVALLVEICIANRLGRFLPYVDLDRVIEMALMSQVRKLPPWPPAPPPAEVEP
ncbi:MAG: hypothetical protein ACHQ0J_01305 [Candidatus Dormibacterales bacterium]